MNCRRGACATKGVWREGHGNTDARNPGSRMIIGLQGRSEAWRSRPETVENGVANGLQARLSRYRLQAID